jgi:hypothetical protein
MSTKGTVNIIITQQIEVDAEIANEIIWLNHQGVRTESSCSGHGNVRPTALITPSSKARAEELGYIPEYMEDLGYFKLTLCTRIVEVPIIHVQRSQCDDK